MEFLVPADHRVKIKESKKIPESCLKAEKAVQREDNADTNCSQGPGNGPQKPGTGDRIKTIQITALLKPIQILKKCAENLRRLVITQILVKNPLVKTDAKIFPGSKMRVVFMV